MSSHFLLQILMQIMILDLRAFQDYPGKKKLRRRCQSFLPKPSRAEQSSASPALVLKPKLKESKLHGQLFSLASIIIIISLSLPTDSSSLIFFLWPSSTSHSSPSSRHRYRHGDPSWLRSANDVEALDRGRMWCSGNNTRGSQNELFFRYRDSAVHF